MIGIVKETNSWFEKGEIIIAEKLADRKKPTYQTILPSKKTSQSGYRIDGSRLDIVSELSTPKKNTIESSKNEK